MAHAQKPDFVFPRNERVHLNRWGRQFSRLLAAEVCASALEMLDTPCSEVAWEYWLPTPFASFPFTSPPVRHLVPSGSERALQTTLFTFIVGSFNWTFYRQTGYSEGFLWYYSACPGKWRLTPQKAKINSLKIFSISSVTNPSIHDIIPR